MTFPLSRPDTNTDRLAWFRSGLFWRTFVLLAFLIMGSMAAWVASLRVVEREPRAEQLANQIISVVTITRAALTHSAPDMRIELLFDLASNEGIRVYPLEKDDVVLPPRDSTLMPLLQTRIRNKLGSDTRFARKVNDVAGFWVSFKIDGDDYWLMMDRDRIDRTSGIQWLGWAAVTLLLALLGAGFISRLINQPLARLSAAARAIAKGQQPEPLPERGTLEIREANQSFNHMVDDLNRIESDRAVILAGISHDLRTPISRMLLEVEMAKLNDEARAGMQSDLAQMDGIIGQFLDYAKPTDTASFETIDLSQLLELAAQEASRLPDVRVTTHIDTGITIKGNRIELERVVTNLIENARRYGKTGDSALADIDLICCIEGGKVLVEVGDHGNGIPESEMDRLRRPFTRLDVARGQANGSGLGLAIVERVIRRHSGKLHLRNRHDHGLIIEIMLPVA
ncbi:sensor histidine kinase [Actimicrobium sp. CCI2.3]|uniref:sensor histidine kinase n=1 Tax=Actimicrobium sp. CCI2.3 TaxID=3048616 RepID=UPI002AB598AB|nr:ATP-binding protein [Actimicrobium sp. CCI2.3]MDY7574541.1 ATP-binding protein [Actimicrobium sp. CCI2.3]MEB0020918.1 ATP-binding protein [Actimicrobium sp. CCI2.3]